MTAHKDPIVVGVDASSGSDRAVEWAVRTARSFGAAVDLVCVYSWDLAYGSLPTWGGDPASDRVLARTLAEEAISSAVAIATEGDGEVPVQGRVIDGNAVDELIELSAKARLLVMGSRPLGPLGLGVLGSVSASVAARSHCPAAVIRDVREHGITVRSIVVGIEGTPESEEVLAFAFDLAGRSGLELRAVLCWHPDRVAPFLGRLQPPAPADAHALLSETMAGWREKYPEVAVKEIAVRDYPVDGLIHESVLSRGVIIVGKHGHHALRGTLLGSVSQGVLHHARGPVIVVPTANAS